MKTSFLLWGGIIGAGYFAAKGFNKSVAIKNLDYKNPKIKVGKLSLSGIPLDIKLDIVNNSSEDLYLEYFTGNINYQDKLISSFTFNGNGQQIRIAPRGITQVPFTVILKSLATITTLVKIVKQIKTGSPVNTVLKIDARFYAAGIDLPVKFSYDLKTQSLVETSQKKISGIAGIGAIDTRGCQYFKDGENINNLDDLRKEFYRLSKLWHPDTGGSTADFQQLQNEYERLKYRTYTSNNYTKEQVDTETELDQVLNAIYEKIMNIPGITIEVAGKWLWISGNTYPVKDQLKSAGLKFASAKKMWYFAGSEHRGRGHEMDIQDIRKKYGSEILKGGSNKNYLSGTGGDSFVMLLEKLKYLLKVRKPIRSNINFSKN